MMILMEDDTQISIEHEKYDLYFTGVTITMLRKKSEKQYWRIPGKYVIDYALKTLTSVWEDGHKEIEHFKGTKDS